MKNQIIITSIFAMILAFAPSFVVAQNQSFDLDFSHTSGSSNDYTAADSIGSEKYNEKVYVKRKSSKGKVYLTIDSKSAVFIDQYQRDTVMLGHTVQIWSSSTGEMIVQTSKKGHPHGVSLDEKAGTNADGTDVYVNRNGKFYIWLENKAGTGIYQKYANK